MPGNRWPETYFLNPRSFRISRRPNNVRRLDETQPGQKGIKIQILLAVIQD